MSTTAWAANSWVFRAAARQVYVQQGEGFPNSCRDRVAADETVLSGDLGLSVVHPERWSPRHSVSRCHAATTGMPSRGRYALAWWELVLLPLVSQQQPQLVTKPEAGGSGTLPVHTWLLRGARETLEASSAKDWREGWVCFASRLGPWKRIEGLSEVARA